MGMMAVGIIIVSMIVVVPGSFAEPTVGANMVVICRLIHSDLQLYTKFEE